MLPAYRLRLEDHSEAHLAAGVLPSYLDRATTGSARSFSGRCRYANGRPWLAESAWSPTPTDVRLIDPRDIIRPAHRLLQKRSAL
jgi:hypothetical protein